VISMVSRYRPFLPTLLGKASTFVQLATLLVALGAAAGISFVSGRVVQALVYATAVVTAASGIHYLVALRHYARTPPSGSGVSGV